MSNHIDFEYIIQWYGANGVIPSVALRCIARPAGPAGTERTVGSGAGVAAQRLERLAHGAEAVGADVEQSGARLSSGEDADVGEVVGVHELVAVGAVAEHDRVAPVGDPVEQDAEDAEAAVPEDRARSHDRHVETLTGSVETGPFGGELGVAVGLHRRRYGRRQDGVRVGHAEHRARRGVDHLGHAGVGARLEKPSGAVDVDGSQEVQILASGTWATLLMHDVDAVDGVANRGAIADVAGDELDLVGAIVGVVQVEDADPMPGGPQAIDEQRTEVATAAGDENEAHSSMPWSRHQRMLRRMPSYSSTSGS